MDMGPGYRRPGRSPRDGEDGPRLARGDEYGATPVRAPQFTWGMRVATGTPIAPRRGRERACGCSRRRRKGEACERDDASTVARTTAYGLRKRPRGEDTALRGGREAEPVGLELGAALPCLKRDRVLRAAAE